MMKIAVLGIDLGKNVCSVVGLDPSGAVVLRRRVRRDTLIDLVAKLPSCIVGMEACCGAHHLGRLFAAQGHDVRLMSPARAGSLRRQSTTGQTRSAGCDKVLPSSQTSSPASCGAFLGLAFRGPRTIFPPCPR